MGSSTYNIGSLSLFTDICVFIAAMIASIMTLVLKAAIYIWIHFLQQYKKKH